jgi:hypothetical protein
MVSGMDGLRIIQGRKIGTDDIHLIMQLLTDNPAWNRTKLSKELCKIWRWQRPDGQPKDMACRTLLLKLERAGQITLPPRQRPSTNGYRRGPKVPVPHRTDEIRCSLTSLRPLHIMTVSPESEAHPLFTYLLSSYHYLGHNTTVGENMKYLVQDRYSRPLACFLFGSAAWKTAPRDDFIGWDHRVRERKLYFVTNNTRFLILPWVRVPHLASHILSLVSKRICSDWMGKYGHPVYLLETFVDCGRFRGTCYKAANWILLGRTEGRTRNDRSHTIHVSPKDVYVYPLHKDFRRKLCHVDS